MTRYSTIALALIVVPAGLARAQTVVYVDHNANQEPYDGSSWCTAFTDLQDALGSATSGTTIRVADGTYKPDHGTGHRNATFQLVSGVALEGGYAGCGAADPNERNIALYETILSGDIGTVGENSDNCYHVVTAYNVDATGVLDGLTITGGNADGNFYSRKRGGGMYNEDSSPTLTNCNISGNSAEEKGGGVYNEDSDPALTNCNLNANSADNGGGMYSAWHSNPTVSNCTFGGNSADSYGGGMYNTGNNGSATLTDCTFSDNMAYDGGGMYNEDEIDPLLSNCIFTGNSAGYRGGGIYNQDDSSPTLTDCTFSGNSAGYRGGGMYNQDDSDPTLTDCTFSGNSAEYGGGMYSHYYQSHPTLTNCTFSGNSADYGGGMAGENSHPTLTNCTFSENSGSEGGGMYNFYLSEPTLTNCRFNRNSADTCGGGMHNKDRSNPTLTNCTFSGNTGGRGSGMCNEDDSSPTVANCIFIGNWANDGGGMYNSYGSSPTVTSCILWGNTAATGPQIYDDDSTTIANFSCIQGGWPGTGNIDADPMLVDADGPDNEPGTPDDDMHLAPGSPCIDAGDNAGVPGDVEEDLDGYPRFMDDSATEDSGLGTPPIVDMGVFEFWVDCNGNGVPDAVDIAEEASDDCDANLVPDECDPDADADGIPDDCESIHNVTQGTWHGAIQLAIGAAQTGDEIEVEAGTYHERIDPLGKAITLRSIDGRELTIIDGDAGGSVITCTSGEGPDTVIEGFTVTNGDAEYGGGMYNDGSSPTLTNCTFSGNSATWYGGGMYNEDSSPTLRNCAFSGNRAYRGGGIYDRDSNPALSDCTFSGNSANWDGGGINNDDYSSPTLTNCIFSGNSAALEGGGMHNDDHSSPTLTNCVFSGNSADYNGGGMYNNGYSNPTLRNCTFTANSAHYDGGGMGNWYSSSPTLTSCLFWSNTAETGQQIYDDDSATTATYSCIEGGWPGAGNIDTDPMFRRQPDDGGDGWGDDPDTAEVDESANDDHGDLRLGSESPGIDAGDPAYVPQPGETDLDGHARVLCGRVDMGAYEFGIGDFDCDQVVDFFDFAPWEACMTGPDAGPYAPGCEAIDFEFDGDVDLTDYAGFQRVFAGP